jgi:hypothetical protein
MSRWGRTAPRANTLNVCLGHVSFPRDFVGYVDVMLSPRQVTGPSRTIVVDDREFGEHGSALSEYAQLLWLCDHFDTIVNHYEFVRIFQYRRFVARTRVGRPSSVPHLRWIKPEELVRREKDFSRVSTTELFNQVYEHPGGMLAQYESAHVLVDIINFSRFLLEAEILDGKRVALFLSEQPMIPACNMGTFRAATLREILMTLKRAAEFIKTGYFTPRSGYQRRVVGFLLERLNSHLLLHRLKSGLTDASRGHHILISDGPVVEITKELPPSDPPRTR